MTGKRFTSEYNNQSDMIQYIDTQKEEPNRWSVCNVSETLKKLNHLHEEKEQLLHIIDWCLTHHREVGHIVFDSRDEFFIWLKEKGVLE